MTRRLYTILLYLLTPLIFLRLLWRSRRQPAYRRRWRERLGWVPAAPAQREVIWVHSVSVGETVAAVPMIRRLQARYPDALVAVTTMTPTGSERVSALLGDSVLHCYAPYDLPDAVARFLARVRPRMLVIMETELWPNLIHQCRQRGIPVILANARLSARSAAGYRRLQRLARSMLEDLSLVAAQSVADGERFMALGLSPRRLEVTGNIKFDLELGERQRALASELGREWRGQDGRPVWLVASTHDGEEEQVLTAFARVREAFPTTLLVLVPRHPERFVAVAQLCREAGFEPALRSAGDRPGPDTAVLLGDTMGELPVFFGACDLAFVGGSLVPVGGHNLLEPAAWGVPVLSGSRLFNFTEVSRLLEEAGALERCDNSDELAAVVIRLLGDPQGRRRLGEAARGVVEANRGAMERLLDAIARARG